MASDVQSHFDIGRLWQTWRTAWTHRSTASLNLPVTALVMATQSLRKASSRTSHSFENLNSNNMVSEVSRISHEPQKVEWSCHVIVFIYTSTYGCWLCSTFWDRASWKWAKTNSGVEHVPGERSQNTPCKWAPSRSLNVVDGIVNKMYIHIVYAYIYLYMYICICTHVNTFRYVCI